MVLSYNAVLTPPELDIGVAWATVKDNREPLPKDLWRNPANRLVLKEV
jgi:hypothetical protein